MAHSGFLAVLHRQGTAKRFLSSLKHISESVVRKSSSPKYILCTSNLSNKETRNRFSAVRLLHTGPCLGAGHSKWQNIKHTKAANDREKSIKSSMLARKIQLALAKNPEIDPKLNTEISNLIKWARTNNIPGDVIDKSLDKQVKLRDPKNITAFEGLGPSNLGIVIECFSLNPVHTKGLLQGIVKKFGFNLHVTEVDIFDYKGIVEVELPAEDLAKANSEPENFSLDKYVDMAIDVGAEEVKLEYDEVKPYLQFVCGPFDLNKVQKAISDIGLIITCAERTYFPKIVVPVNEEFMEGLEKLKEKLDLNNDVIKYHFNIELQSS